MHRLLLATSLAVMALLPACYTLGPERAPDPIEDVTVVYCKNVPADDMADALNEFLAQDAAVTGERTAVVKSHAHSNSVMIRASGKRHRQLLTLIERLDVKRPQPTDG